MKTALIASLCALALSAPAVAQTTPPNQGQVLTQEYAALYRAYLDKKKLGLEAEAQSKYGEFLTAFRKHRLLARGIVSVGSGPAAPGEPGGLPLVPPAGASDSGTAPVPGDGGVALGRPGTPQPPIGGGDGGVNPDERPQVPGVGGDNGGGTTTTND